MSERICIHDVPESVSCGECDATDAMHAIQRSPEPDATTPKTIRVRIAVAVHGSGEWSACGWIGSDAGELRDAAVDGIDGAGAYSTHWIEADVPLPVEVTIEGRVT